MRALDVIQEARVRARAIVPVKIAKLTQYSDRTAGTVAATYYFSDRVVRYPYDGGAVIQADAALRGCDPVSSSISDVPSPESRYADALISSTRIVLANAPFRGGLYLEEVLAAYPLEGADLEVIELAILPSADRSLRFDLSSYAGTEHTVWFRGRISRCEGVDDSTIQLRAESTLPVLRWLYATDPATTDPKDLGARFPLPVGPARSVKALGAVVGWNTTLVRPLPAAAGVGTLVELTDVTGLPSSGTIRVDAEEMTYDSLDSVSRTVSLTARGASGTAVVDHAPAAYAVEQIAESVYVLSQRPLSAVRDVYLRNPYNGEKTRAPDLLPGVTLADADFLPGETISTLRIPVALMRTVLTDFYRSARVTQQPEFADAGDAVFANAAPNGTSPGVYSLSPTIGTRYRSFGGAPDSPRWTRVENDPYQVNLGTQISFGATVWPDVEAISVELLATVEYNTTGSAAGTYQIYLHPNGFPGFGEPSFNIPIPANQSGSAPWTSGARGISLNPSALGPRYMQIRPYVAGAIATAAGKYVGLSNIRLRFGYLDSGNIQRVQDVAIDGASTGFGLDLFFDADGELVPVPFVDGYSFDSVSGVSAAGCTASADATVKSEGAASWKLEATETVIEDFESASGWTTYGGVSVALETGIKTEGSGSIYASGGGSDLTTSTRQLLKSGLSPIDCSGGLLAVDVYLTQAMWDYLSDYGLEPTTGLLVGVTSDASYSTHYKQWMFGRNHIRPDAWSTLIWDPDDLPFYYSGSGTLVLSSVRGYQFGFVPTTIGVTTGFYWDRFRVLPREMRAQLNATAGALDLSADSDTYRLSLRASASTDFEDGEVYFENTAGSGTTPPAARRTLPFAPVDVGVGAFAEASPAPVDVGSPAFDDVETVGVVVTLPASPPQELIDLPTVWVDDLRRRDDATNPYAGTPGTLITRRPDVLRYLTEEVCGEAGACDAASFAAADTNLGGASTGFGVDLRELGETFQSIAVRMAYEARANLVRVETATGAKFRLLTAGSSYTYGASVRTLTDVAPGGIAFAGQDVAELRSRFFAYYAFDAAKGDASSGGYLSLAGATPELSDPTKPTASALADSEEAFGSRPADYLFFRCIQDETTALDTLGYYASVRSQARRVVILTGLSWRQGYDLELGDVVTVQPRWRSTPIVGRVIEYVKDFRTQVVNLRLAEVPT